MFKVTSDQQYSDRSARQERSRGDALAARPGSGLADPLRDPLGTRVPGVQLSAAPGAPVGPPSDPGMHAVAGRGVSGGGAPLPHGDRIQEAFGRHDVSDVRAHVGGAAAEAAGQMGAVAFATGRDVAFRQAPDLHTAAHEAAHVVQQGSGVSLKGGVGRSGDPYERHADAVADAVVAGRSAEALLDGQPGSPNGSTRAVQAKTWWEAAQGPARPAGVVTAPRIWFRTSPQTVDGNHLMLVDQGTRVDIVDANVPSQDTDEWKRKRPKWAKVRVGFLEGYLPADLVQVVSPAGEQSASTPSGSSTATSGGPDVAGPPTTPSNKPQGESEAQGPVGSATKPPKGEATGAAGDGAIAASGHLAKMMATNEFKQIPFKPDGVLIRGIIKAFQQWLDAGCREKALDLYTRKKEKEHVKELKARSTAKDLAIYHVRYTCNFFTQFMLSNGDWLKQLNADRNLKYEAFKEAVEARLAEYFARRLIGPEGEGSVRYDGRVMKDEGIRDVVDQWDHGAPEQQKGESKKDFAKRKKAWKANKAGRKEEAIEAWKGRSGKSVDEFGEKCAQVLQYEGMMVRITVRQAEYKNGQVDFLYYKDGKPKYHFFAGFVTPGEQPMLVTYDHQNSPRRVGPFPLLDPHAAKNSHYFWSTFQSAVPQG